jgi:hypothetical protein
MREEADRAGWAGDFDWFRANYDRLTFEDLKRIYAIWLKKYPVQVSHDPMFVIDSLWRIVSEVGRDDLSVAELGGYNGQLALEAFKHFPRLNWLNIEIIQHRPVSGLDKYRYTEYILSAQIWEDRLKIDDKDVFVSQDTLEHFPDHEFERIVELLLRSKPRYLILKIPVLEAGQDWSAIASSHLLRLGKGRIKMLLSSCYEILMEQSQPLPITESVPAMIRQIAIPVLRLKRYSRITRALRRFRNLVNRSSSKLKKSGSPGWSSLWRLRTDS